MFYPIIKACWTTPFNLLTGGIVFLLITLFYWIIVVKDWNKWSVFFREIGMDSTFIYLFHRFSGANPKLLFSWTFILEDIESFTSSAGSIMEV